MLLRINRFGDLQGAAAFLDTKTSQKKFLLHHPLQVLDMDMESDEFKAFFNGEMLKDARRMERQSGKAIRYLALSIHPVSAVDAACILCDPDCVGLWILCEKKEHICREWFLNCLESQNDF